MWWRGRRRAIREHQQEGRGEENKGARRGIEKECVVVVYVEEPGTTREREAWLKHDGAAEHDGWDI